MITVREHIILFWQKCTGRVNHVNTWKIVLHRNFLSSNMLFHSHGIISSSLEAVIIGNDHTLPSVYYSYSSNYITAWDTVIFIHVVITCKLTNLKEWTALVDDGIDPLSGQKLVSFD
jgi:hypothetical protein